jgi:hypothetical protein
MLWCGSALLAIRISRFLGNCFHLTRLSLSCSDLETVGDDEDGSVGHADVLRPQRSEFDKLGPASPSQQLYGLVHAAALNISSYEVNLLNE